ncbi:tyrosine-protein phosphatase [Spirosoma endbachense]|uniref:Protein-tyrosine-phosphatase n=1 Tax=Spirosoma endbachense TaxID=2666025 RepID=A0A6P1VWU3_9BACT|nr:tyrosine-protein phosphatase [Spirosoma endbachense]QHV95836.1 protein-tyrosine-phosphatase [Spirosoma endbachense]
MKKLTLFFCILVSSIALGQNNDTLVYNAKRAVVLEGASNFRDLGGYPTQNGHHVKWGHLYRSADISKLTDADLKILADRHIATVCDLRGPEEIKTNPDRLPAGSAWFNMPAGSESTRATTASLMGAKPANRDSMMLAFYARTDHLKAKYKPMFDQLLALNNDKALLFHCTAGKDRTGVGAALILSALGVDRPFILKDYAATNEYWKGNREQVIQSMTKQGMDEKTVKSMLAANPSYLQNTFDAIDRQYGSMDKFLAQEMELTPKKLTQLRSAYVQ